MKIFYDKPLKKLRYGGIFGVKLPSRYGAWEQAYLPLGNGSLGLTVSGEERERVVVNYKTLWKGGPSPLRPDYNGGNATVDADGKTPVEYFDEVRRLFSEGENEKASELCDKLIGEQEGYGGYLCWGALDFDFGKISKLKNYARTLDLDRGVLEVVYDGVCRGVKVSDKRAYFVSHPDGAAVIRLEREGGPLDCEIGFSSGHGAAIKASSDGITQYGELDDNGLKFGAALLASSDGKIESDGTGLRVKDASYIELFLSCGTDYLDNYPIYRDGETAEGLQSRIYAAADRVRKNGFAETLERHVADYAALYGRVKLDLGGSSGLPTDKLVARYKNLPPKDRRYLETLVYQYGRYLTIASSREDDLLPSNLQGIWNCSDNPAWGGDFHLNVNLQMNYWPTYVCNLAECARPLIRYIEALRDPGRLTAKTYTGSDGKRGYLFHTQNTPFGWTCPGWDFSWGWSPAAVCWILHNLYEYYEYTLDAQTLADTIFPLLCEAADYFASLLIEIGDRLVSAPCYSPEHGPRTAGNAYEQSLLWQLFDDATNAAANCGDSRSWKNVKSRLKPLEIGDDGQIKEWYDERGLGQIGQKNHRHISHLLGFYPCNVADRYGAPEYARAAAVSIKDRGETRIGWAAAQRANTWARLGDGERAAKCLETLISNCLYPNLWNLHPPFQIDGNFGYAAGVNEMLMQSHAGFIELLPAKSPEWKEGRADGLVARGGFELSFDWKNGTLSQVEVYSAVGGKCKLFYAPKKLSPDTKTLKNFAYDGNILVFDTQKGGRYRIFAE